MNKNKSLKLAAFSALVMAVFWLMPGNVRAQEATSSPTAYEYTVRKNDSLTKLVRRSIQIYSTEKQKSLSPAAAMFVETNVVKTLGDKPLEINQKVSVPTSELDKYVSQSATLSAAQLARWDKYAKTANFSLSGLEPTNVQSSEQAEEQKTEESKPAEQQAETTTDTQGSEDKEENKNEWYWWVIIAALAVAVGYYLFANRNQAEPAKPTRSRRSK